MLFFYVGLVAIIFGILGKFLLETYKLMSTLLFGDLAKIDLIIKVLELVDMTMWRSWFGWWRLPVCRSS